MWPTSTAETLPGDGESEAAFCNRYGRKAVLWALFQGCCGVVMLTFYRLPVFVGVPEMRTLMHNIGTVGAVVMVVTTLAFLVQAAIFYDRARRLRNA